MCFSTGASFGAGAVLTLIGVASARKVHDRSQVPLALFPFIFAGQQFAEGFVWLSLSKSDYSIWHDIAIYSFLTFSHIIWPVWIPFSIMLLEMDLKRRKMLKFLLAAGIMLALYHVYCLMYLPVNTRINGHHLQYLIAHPVSLLIAANILYGLSTILPPFISSIRRIWWLGLFIIVSYIAAYLMYRAYVISVWCYFATMLSVIVYLILTGLRKVSPGQSGSIK
jgi:hypothetical protein